MTPRQAEVLNFIRRELNTKGVAPTVMEIAEKVGCQKSNAKRFIDQLVKKGHLMRSPNRARCLWIPNGHVPPAGMAHDILNAARQVLDSIFYENTEGGIVVVSSEAFGLLDAAVAELDAPPPKLKVDRRQS